MYLLHTLFPILSLSDRTFAMPGIKDAKCILVLGATSGIGRDLALALHGLDSKPIVIVAGRRQERLDEICKQGERIKTARIDITSSEDTLKEFVQHTLSQYPDVRSCHHTLLYRIYSYLCFAVGRRYLLIWDTAYLQVHATGDYRPEQYVTRLVHRAVRAKCFLEFQDEISTNYLSIFKLIVLFLPHFLKLSVSMHI